MFGISKWLLVVIGVLVIGAGTEGYLLRNSYIANGKITSQLDAANGQLKKVNNAQRSRDATEHTAHALSDDDLLNHMRD
jgi:cell division protein FtsB